MLRARRGARLTAITNGGAIPDTADYDVIEFPSETFVGKVNEDFAIESLAGDIFLLGQPFLANSPRRLRQSSCRRRPGPAAEIPFLAGRSAGAHPGAYPKRSPICASDVAAKSGGPQPERRNG